MANRTESWRNRKTLMLGGTDMMGLLTPAEYVACVEQAYRMHGEGRFVMEPKGYIVLDKYPGEWEAMPSYIEEAEAAACKWVSIREQNRERFDLPTVFSILIYTHPETGRSEEHTSELQSLTNLVCRLLLEKKKNNKTSTPKNNRDRTSRDHASTTT